ncbi:SDR family oxidoreductase [Martelella endophytica]|uniref:Short-chain dehydrogenase n=1 Tax=Martelella endophytica TaxID=1486262 RepID=A0A0D5LNL7_MAREN|nr:SDR family oxidoreductase [Martelella endophytica]AJY45844.1 short-chain dehydrogenase [Martelella endophytica]
MRDTWFITGVSSGFGRAMSEQVLASGGRVFGTVREASAIADLQKRYPDRFRHAVVDMVDGDTLEGVVADAFEAFGRIDVVVNNAGYGLFGAAEALSDAQIRHQIDTNLVAPILITKAALPYLRAQGGGRIIAVSSYGGQATHPGASLYHASKWGLEGFFDALAQEVAAFDIGVTIVEPGGARTGFRSAAGAGLPDDIADYAKSPAGMVRKVLENPGHEPAGDPDAMSAAIIASADQNPAPLRLVLGDDARGFIEKALKARLAALDA